MENDKLFEIIKNIRTINDDRLIHPYDKKQAIGRWVTWSCGDELVTIDGPATDGLMTDRSTITDIYSIEFSLNIKYKYILFYPLISYFHANYSVYRSNAPYIAVKTLNLQYKYTTSLSKKELNYTNWFQITIMFKQKVIAQYRTDSDRRPNINEEMIFDFMRGVNDTLHEFTIVNYDEL